jgi:hypothetical protein
MQNSLADILFGFYTLKKNDFTNSDEWIYNGFVMDYWSLVSEQVMTWWNQKLFYN